MAGEQILSPPMGSYQPRTVTLFGYITITGGAGAIGSQSGMGASGVTFVKNATAGRYDGTLNRGYRRAVKADANVTSPTAGNVPVVTDGNLAYVNGISAANFLQTPPTPITTFSIQCCTSNGVATAANPKAGDTIAWRLEVSDS